jgi:DNA-binding Xre family transcriptional regulator
MSIKHVTSKPLSELRSALHKVRINRDLTYDQLAGEVGVSRRNLIKFMNEPKAGVRDRWLGRVVRYLDAQESSNAAAASPVEAAS